MKALFYKNLLFENISDNPGKINMNGRKEKAKCFSRSRVECGRREVVQSRYKDTKASKRRVGVNEKGKEIEGSQGK